jgi:hypothetical protein
MPTPLDLESLFAGLGLEAVLNARPALPKYKIDAAAKLPATIRRRITRFMATEKFAPAKDVPDFEYRDVLEQVSAQKLGPEQMEALFAAVPDRELATDLGLKADEIIAWAFGIIPREDMPAAFGMVADEPGVSATADFRRVWQVAEDPMRVLDDLEDGSLGDDQIAALATLYPAIYAEMRQAITEANAALVARLGKTWEPSPLKASLLLALKMEPATDLALTAAIQAVYAQEEAEQQAPPPRKPLRQGSGKTGEAEGGLTPGQASSAG